MRRRTVAESVLEFFGLVMFVVVVVLFFVWVARVNAAPLPPHQGHPILPVSAKEAARERALPKTGYALRTASRVSRHNANLRMYMLRMCVTVDTPGYDGWVCPDPWTP